MHEIDAKCPANVEPDRVGVRPSSMVGNRRGVRLLGALALVVPAAACGGSQGTSAGSCAGPYIDNRPPGRYYKQAPTPSVTPGHSLVIYGHWYTSTCNDTGGTDPLVPLRPVKLTLTLPGGADASLGEFKPGGRDMGFRTTVYVPPGTPRGTAKVRDDRQSPATYVFEVRG